MATTIDLELAQAVRDAASWAKRHPGRDALDAAYAAIMNAPKVGLGGQHDRFGRGDEWAAFVAAVKVELSA